MPCLWLLLNCQSFSVPAQSVIPDRLRIELQSIPDDSIKLKKLIGATSFSSFTQPDSAIFYADSIIRFAEKIEYPYGRASGNSLKAEAYIRDNDDIIISVIDNGNCIPAAVLSKIFQPFFTTKPAGQGTGLGLSLSYDIVKAHDGKLTVRTKEGHGSEFTIPIPCHMQ